MKKRYLILLVLSALLPLFAEEEDTISFSRYQVILDRKPFGDSGSSAPSKTAVSEGKAPELAKEEQDLSKKVDLVAVNITPSGRIAVGIVDKDINPPVNYYIYVGEEAGGFSVLDADFQNETALIEKKGIQLTLKLGVGALAGGDTSASATDKPRDAPSATSPNPPTNFPSNNHPSRRFGSLPGSGSMSPHSGESQNSLLRRRKAARDAEQKAAFSNEMAKVRQEMREEMRARVNADAERRANLERIANGEEPTSPIELTPEEDAELVEKGILSPE